MRLIRLLGATGLLFLILPTVSASSASATPPPCVIAQLMVLGSDVDGLAGTGIMVIGIANTGTTCRVGGFPQVTFFNAKSVAVDHRDAHVSSMAFAEPRSVTVTLRHDGAASVGVSWSDNPVTLTHGHATTCPATGSLQVQLLHGVGHLLGTLYGVDARPCGGGVEVTPIEAGSWPRPNG